MRARKWPIRYQLAAIVVVPLVALAVASTRQTYVALERAAEADQVELEASFAVSVNTLVHELQRERGLSGGHVGSGYQEGLAEVTAQRVQADEALRRFHAESADIRSGGSRSLVRSALDDTEAALAGLDGQRRAIDLRELDVTDTLSYYTETIAVLLSVDRAIVEASEDARTARIATAFLDLSQSKEFTGLERGFMNSVFSAGRFGRGDHSRLLTIVAQQDAWFALFRITADPATLRFYDEHVVGPEVDRAAELRASALAVAESGDEGRALNVEPTEWWSVMTVKIDLMRDVELRMTEQLREHASSVVASAHAATARDVTVALVVMGLSLALSVVTARRMARSLRGLRDAAHEAADVRLPAVVASLAEGREIDVDKETEPLHIDSNDEIGETATAFNRVHSVAVRLTVDQAGMRRNLSDMLLNLARRSQTLVHQQLELIDEMERSESDSGKLKSLFRIDHSATRMRRHTEDLIVLSGASPSRGWSAPVPLRDVVRGAIAEVESYSRVEAVRLPDVAVVGHAVGDLLHLLAELIENATKFSPPHAPVMVTAGEVGNGYVVEIEDRGLGMPPGDMARHNERLADPPAFDLSTSDRLGLFVVGRLAARHSVRVCLRDSVYGGVTAVVLVGRELICPVDQAAEAGGSDDDVEAGRGAGADTPARLDPGAGPLPVGMSSVGVPAADADWDGVTGAGRDGGSRVGRHRSSGRLPIRTVGGPSTVERPLPAPSPALPPMRSAIPPRVPTPAPAPGGPAPGRPAAGEPDPSAPDGLTAFGLPRRVPRKHLTAALRRDAPSVAERPAARAPAADAPSPEEIRALLGGYQSGFDRGWTEERRTEERRTEGRRADGRVDRHQVADRVLDYPTRTIRRGG